VKAYWDSSALVQTTVGADLNTRLTEEGGFTRTHALTETFSALTGRLSIRLDANAAAKTIKAMARYLEFVDLSPGEILEGLSHARNRGVRGGRVHDYVHALAAAKSGASALLMMDRNDFDSLVPRLSIEQI
jgi:predicted nucleic acid-binding protein